MNNSSITTKPSGRIGYIDVAKGIAIILVILSHMWIPGITRILFSFHMPVFFVISGYFLNNKKTLHAFVLTRIRQLMIPFFITASSIFLYRSLHIENDFSLLMEGEQFTKILYGRADPNSVGAIWFLPALCVACIIVRSFMETKRAALWVIFVASVGYLTGKILWLPMSIQAGMVSALFVYAGHLAKKYDITQSRYFRFCPELCMIAAFWMYGAWRYGVMHLSSNTFPAGIDSILVGFAGVIVFIKLCSYVARIPVLSRMFSFLGRHSLMILCFHCFEDSLHLASYLHLSCWQTFLVRTVWAVGATCIVTGVAYEYKGWIKPFFLKISQNVRL